MVEYLSNCLECDHVKVDHQHPAKLLNSIHVPEKKWEIISLDFIIGLPKTKRQHDSIMVVVDTLSKETQFIPVQSTFGTTTIAHISMEDIFQLHGIPKMILSDRDAKFTSNFWEALFGCMGNKLNFNTTYHPQMNGQTQRTNQILDDMLRMYVMDRPTKWEYFFHLFEFSYNKNYQTSIKMITFKALYGKMCHTQCQSQLEDRLILGLDAL